MKQSKIFFDTNVLVYAHDSSSLFHADSASLLSQVFNRKIQGVIAEQNVIELYRILTNPSAMKERALTPVETYNLITRTYLNNIFELICPQPSDIYQTLALAQAINAKSARIFDLRLAVLALEAKIDYLATYNTQHFQGIPNLFPLTPGEILNQLPN